MKLACFVLFASLVASGQTINWKTCTDLSDKVDAQVQKLNEQLKGTGFSIMFGCLYSGDPKRVKKPSLHIDLSPSEIRQLHALRKVEDASIDAMEEYHDHLLAVHHVRKPDLRGPCYYFVGFVIDTDYITVDPNPMFATDTCEIEWRAK